MLLAMFHKNITFCVLFSTSRGNIGAVVEDKKYRHSPIGKGGLEIVIRATFKIDDSKRSLLHRLKELIEKNCKLLYESVTDEEESLASGNEKDLSIVFMIDDEAEED